MNTQTLADKKLAFYAPAVPDKYRDNVPPYVCEVTLYTSPSVDDGYETGVSLTGVIDGREVIGRLKRGLYDKTISFECPNTRQVLFYGELIVSHLDGPMIMMLSDDLNPGDAKKFFAESVSDIDPSLKEWGDKESVIHAYRNKLFGMNEGQWRTSWFMR